MTERTSNESFDELHSLVAESLIEQIKAWKESRLVEWDAKANDGEGDYVTVFPPALLAQAIKFLKDNGIDSPAEKSKKLKTLSETMPELPGSNVVKLTR